ncbi:putative Glutamyl-tRNA(Gln) amidotransferase subunit A [Nannochloris sp. 'desiccata']|nr:putative Glutamyl-tRNA(Gln) amidotransferase subunit A [Chlorella desiccata (nom. nud.)]
MCNIFVSWLSAILLLIQTHPSLASSQGAAINTTLPGLPYPEDAIGTMAVSVAELRTGLCNNGAPALPVAELTISEVHAAFANGILNCSSLVNAYLQRIDSFDTRTGLNAIISLNPDVLNEADRLDRMLKASFSSSPPNSTNGKITPQERLFQQHPLFCVPILVKDNFDVVGMPTTAGSVALAQNYPQKDATVVERLKSAGAIILAKSSMGELALFPIFSVSSLGPGIVRNPYHLGYTPAGSSGGSAAGTAANLALAAIGSDTGNSVRGPASHTALVGLRPSIGLVSRSGMIPLRFDRDTAGPLTRTVEDTARLLTVMQGFDPGDNLTHVLSPHNDSNVNYVRNLTKNGLKGARIGVLAGVENLPESDGEILSQFTEALADLAAAGATIIPDFKIKGNSLGTRDWDVNRNGEGPALGQWFAAGKWQDIWKCSWTIRAGFLEYIQNSTITFPRNLRDLFEQGLYHPAGHQALQLAVHDPVAPSTQDQSPCQCGTLEEDMCRVEFRNNLIKSMNRDHIDAIVYPTWSRPPLMIGKKADGWYEGNNSPMIAPHVGAPAITVPMGYTEAGLPGGLQFLARPFQEAKLLEIAYAYEQFTKKRKPPPLFPECKDPPPQVEGFAALQTAAG